MHDQRSVAGDPSPSSRLRMALASLTTLTHRGYTPRVSSHSTVAARAERALVFAAAGGLILLGVAFAPGLDMFRAPKEAAMRAQAIISVFALAVAIVYGGTSRIRQLLRERGVIAILGGAVLWSIITTLTSQQRILSIQALVTILCSAILFVAVWYVARDVPVAALLVLVPIVVVNTLLAALQEFSIWNPFDFRAAELQTAHLRASALIGNPNDVGGYLAICAVVLFGASEFLRGRLRWIAAIGAFAALAGVIVSQSRTAVITVAAAAAFIGVRRSWKTALVVTLLVIALLVVATRIDLPAFTRVARIPEQLMRGDWDVLFSDRLPAFVAAYGMFRDHPFLGVGPGAYKYLYMSYRIHLSEIYSARLMRGAGVNFAEAHNDHLQLLAETGLPGYALFVAACVVIALRVRRKGESDDERAQFAAQLAIPFVITVAVLALAFFPLQIAATRHLLVTMSALILGWGAAPHPALRATLSPQTPRAPRRAGILPASRGRAGRPLSSATGEPDEGQRRTR
ncbi:MAG: hypothetical protein DMF56_20035 [Acidobacteria bacterium]|nr:MAG: hypothetical protein DMF56_20035 [Acidobacteriota bacterium]